MAPYWVTSTDQLAEPMNKIPKVVFSKRGFVPKASYGDSSGFVSPYTLTWTNAIVETDLVSGITKLKQQEGKPILAHGGAGFAQQLVKYGLVNEYRLVIHPVVIGKGIGLFSLTPNLIDLQLLSSTPFPSGIIINVYATKKIDSIEA